MKSHPHDDDPRPDHSPRLYGDMESVPNSARSGMVVSRGMTPFRRERLRKISIVFACREQVPPVPYSTLIAELGISADTVTRYHKIGKNWAKRRNRV